MFCNILNFNILLKDTVNVTVISICVEIHSSTVNTSSNFKSDISLEFLKVDSFM